MQHIRDEAHRFAISYHRIKRKKRTLTSRLDLILGIGPKRRNQLLTIFGSLKNMNTLSVDEIHKKGKLIIQAAVLMTLAVIALLTRLFFVDDNIFPSGYMTKTDFFIYFT